MKRRADPGPIAAQDWFENNLQRALKVVPKQKLICGMGNYGYDWAVPLPEKGKKPSDHVANVDDLSVQEAWQRASDADADVHLEGDELNAHFAYDDEDAHMRHQVWFLDGVTALNELRASRQMGIKHIRTVASGHRGWIVMVSVGSPEREGCAAPAYGSSSGQRR